MAEEPIREKVEKIEHFLNDVLKVDLKNVLEERDKLYESISEHSQLRQTLACVLKLPPEEGLRTQVDLGCNFYVQAHVPDATRIFMNVGLGFHVEMTLDEATIFIDKKLEKLNGHAEILTKKSLELKAKAKFVLEGLREMQCFDVVDLN